MVYNRKLLNELDEIRSLFFPGGKWLQASELKGDQIGKLSEEMDRLSLAGIEQSGPLKWLAPRTSARSQISKR